MPPISTRVLRYIVDQIREQDAVPTRTKVAKLLYLVDVEYYRRHGRLLTDLSWRFLHYGPYAVELEPQFQSLDLKEEEIRTQKGHRAFTYRVHEPESLDDLLESSDIRLIDRITEKWALESLYRLLDYVYFETEPMRDASRGELLDFSNIVREIPSGETSPEAALPQETLSKFKKTLKAIQESKVTPRHYTPPPYDDIYLQAVATMNLEETGLSSLHFMKNVGIPEKGEGSIAKQTD
jgi:hypothetical protein